MHPNPSMPGMNQIGGTNQFIPSILRSFRFSLNIPKVDFSALLSCDCKVMNLYYSIRTSE